MLEGEAGIGKTSLLLVAVEGARQRGVVALQARGTELEQEFAFGVVRQLFERLLVEAGVEGRRRLLAGAASLAAPLLGLSEESGSSGAAADPVFAAQHGLYWLAVNAAAEAPLLVVVDDAQWADEASLGWLVYLGRRLEGARIGVLLGRRLGDSSRRQRLLAELRAVPRARTAVPAPLSEAATAVLARRVLETEPDERLVRCCHEVTGGNPFLLRELLRTVATEGIGRDASAERRVRQLGPTPVVAELKRRLGWLSAAAFELARAVAVLGVDAELRHAAALARLELPAAEQAADLLVLARILEPGLPLRFRHAIVRTAVLEDIPAGRRSRAHREVAELLDAAAGGGDQAAAHLLMVEPAGDRWVVERLLAAADRALRGGAPEAAIRLLERARREPAEGPETTLALGRALRLAGRHAEAAGYLREAIAALPTGEPREQAARELAVVLVARTAGREALDVLEAEIAQLPPEARERRLRLEADRAWIGLATDEIRRETSERLEALGATVGHTSPAGRVLLGALAALRAYEARGSAAEVAALAERALADGRLLNEQTPDMFTFAWTAQVLLQCDRDELARRQLEAGLAAARAHGDGPTAGVLLLALGRVALYRGELAEAEAAALAARGLVAHRYAQDTASALLAAALIERGQLDQAEQLLGEAGLEQAGAPPLAIGQTLLARRVALRLAQSRPADAAADAEQLLERLASKRHGGLRLRATAALALLAAGARERARELAEQELALALRWGAPSARGAAQRVLGLAAGGQQGLDLLRQASETLEQTACRLETAKALADLGAALRRAKRAREARAPLRRALELAHRCRADRLAATVSEELRACGARPRRPVLSGVDSLTASERRVARLAARGLSNPEVAQALFVTRRTVETHLSAVYRKLDITGRDQLAGLLEEPEQRSQRAPAAGAPTLAGGGRFAQPSMPSEP